MVYIVTCTVFLHTYTICIIIYNTLQPVLEIICERPPSSSHYNATQAGYLPSKASREEPQETPLSSAEDQLTPCGECGGQIFHQGVQCEGFCRWHFHPDCHQTSEQRITDSPGNHWKCDKCLAVSSAIVDLVDTVRDLSATVRSLEALNRQLESRVELLETHDPPPPPPLTT